MFLIVSPFVLDTSSLQVSTQFLCLATIALMRNALRATPTS
jgi:hypothetical protein